MAFGFLGGSLIGNMGGMIPGIGNALGGAMQGLGQFNQMQGTQCLPQNRIWLIQRAADMQNIAVPPRTRPALNPTRYCRREPVSVRNARFLREAWAEVNAIAPE